MSAKLDEKGQKDLALLRRIDSNNDGRVNYEEYYEHINAGYHVKFDPNGDAPQEIVEGLF